MDVEEVAVGEGLRLHAVRPGPVRETLVAMVADLTGAPRGKFPGPSPLSIERADFPALAKAPYVLCEKTDGWRAALMLARYDGLQMAVLFDRKLLPYIIPMAHVPVALWQGSLFDGEVVRNTRDNRWYYLIFDAVRVSGIPIDRRPFRERIRVAVMAWEPYRPDPKDAVRVRIKRFVPQEDVGALAGHLAHVAQEFRTDGIVLTPDVPGIIFGRCRGLFKLKTVHSVDFLVDDSGMGLCVFDSRARMHLKVGELREAAKPKTIVECVHCQDTVWRVLQERTDKTQANDLLTYKKTFEVNVAEALTVDDICRALSV
jgi:hypothetical protein